VTQPSGKLRDLLRTGAGIAVAMAVMNVSTYAFTILAARRLGPAEYGAFGSLMGLLLVVNVLSLGLQATGARRVAAAPGDRDRIEAEVLAATYRSATWLTVACLAAAPLAARVLELDGWWAALTIGAAAFPLTLMGGYAGILQGEQRWLPLAGVYLGMGVGRLAVGAAALLVVPTAFGAMLGVAAAAVVPAVAGALALHRPARARERALAPRGRAVLGEVAGNSHALLAFFALSNTDVVVARIVLPPEDAGLYTAGLILTKAVLFLPQFVVVIAFPSMSQDTQRHRMYLRGLAVVAVIGAAATAGTALLSELAVFFVGGDQYAEVEPLLWLFAALGTAYAMVQLMVYEVVARQHRASVYVVWAGLVVVVASAPALGSVGSLAATVAAVNGGVLLLLLVTALLRRDHAADIASRRALVAPQDDHRSAGQTN
jgi:O-antigen/teichoic acid export membrane protein